MLPAALGMAEHGCLWEGKAKGFFASMRPPEAAGQIIQQKDYAPPQKGCAVQRWTVCARVGTVISTVV